jgi:hypothetical protein
MAVPAQGIFDHCAIHLHEAEEYCAGCGETRRNPMLAFVVNANDYRYRW